MTKELSQGMTFLQEVRPWIIGQTINVYVRGRAAPFSGLTVKHLTPYVLVARWRAATHLISTAQIVCIRFAEDCDPVRNPKHSLHRQVNDRPGRTSRKAPTDRPAATAHLDTSPVTTHLPGILATWQRTRSSP